VLATGSCAAVIVVSTLPWALAAPLPRFAPSVGWLLVVSAIGALASDDRQPPLLLAQSYEASAVSQATLFIVYPFGVVGREFSGAQAMILIPGVAAAVMAMAAACAWIARADFPLEAAQ
jgi:hypothetical protein